MAISIGALRASKTYLDLSFHFGVSDSKLKSAIYGPVATYRKFAIPKRSGGTREICAPIGIRRYLQEQLLPLVSDTYVPTSAAHGFVPGRSVRTNAEPHVARQTVINVDLANFFPSISFKRVRGIFLVAPFNFNWFVANYLAAVVCCEGVLSAGGLCSPALSNIVCARMDKSFIRLTKRFGGLYTRYCDDLTFSFNRNPAALTAFAEIDPLGAWKAGGALVEVIKSNGFSINDKKFRVRSGSSRKTVTGLVVNERANLRWDWIREVEQRIYVCSKFGLDKAAARYFPSLDPISASAALIRQVHGKLAYMFMVRGPGDWVTSRLAFAFNQISQVSNLKIPDVEIVSIKRRMARAICVVKAYKTSKVDIAAPDEVGTGFFFKRGLIVTASHVITSQSTGAAYPNLVVHPAATPGMVIKCDCVANDTHRDVAVLKPQVPIHELSRIRFGPSSRPLAVGMSVTSAGFPNYKLGDSALVLDHRVLNLLIASAVRKANLDGVLYAGMSGGPVVDEDCRLIGLTHRGTAVPGGFANQIVRLSEIESVVATVP